jgi:hypothetical protein
MIDDLSEATPEELKSLVESYRKQASEFWSLLDKLKREISELQAEKIEIKWRSICEDNRLSEKATEAVLNALAIAFAGHYLYG